MHDLIVAAMQENWAVIRAHIVAGCLDLVVDTSKRLMYSDFPRALKIKQICTRFLRLPRKAAPFTSVAATAGILEQIPDKSYKTSPLVGCNHKKVPAAQRSSLPERSG